MNKGELYNSVILGYVFFTIFNALLGFLRPLVEEYANQKVILRVRFSMWRKILHLFHYGKLQLADDDKHCHRNRYAEQKVCCERRIVLIELLQKAFNSLVALPDRIRKRRGLCRGRNESIGVSGPCEQGGTI